MKNVINWYVDNLLISKLNKTKRNSLALVGNMSYLDGCPSWLQTNDIVELKQCVPGEAFALHSQVDYEHYATEDRSFLQWNAGSGFVRLS